jgi:hypothetical protein
MDRVIGRRLFTDGIERDVYEDAQGRQYVLDPDGEKVYGVWLLPADEPVITEAAPLLHPTTPADRAGQGQPV